LNHFTFILENNPSGLEGQPEEPKIAFSHIAAFLERAY